MADTTHATFQKIIDRLDETDRRKRRDRLIGAVIARLFLAVLYGGLLIATAAPPWAFVLALIAATYWGPPR